MNSTIQQAVLVPREAIVILKELTQLTSYAEIVGGVQVNRAAIREQCDLAFDLIRDFENAEDCLTLGVS